MTIQDQFFALLRLAVGDSEEWSVEMQDGDWQRMYEMATKQSLLAVCFRGISKLPEAQRPPEALCDEWLVDCHLNYEANAKAYRCVVGIQKWFKSKGFRSCILKGQANAVMYPDKYIRTAGDIDLWVEGGTRKVLDFVRKRCPDPELCYHHVKFIDYKEIPVEVHFRPSFMNNLIDNRKMQRYFKAVQDRQWEHTVDLPDGIGQACVPTADFNRIFQMGHIYRHLMQNGIGLRQIIDYYYLLRQGFTEEERERDARLFRSMNMYRIAGAVMYIEKTVLGLDDRFLIVPVNRKAGRALLKEIMLAGNFGYHDERVGHNAYAGTLMKNIQRLYRDLLFVFSYPGECLWEPIFRLYHFFWRKLI